MSLNKKSVIFIAIIAMLSIPVSGYSAQPQTDSKPKFTLSTIKSADSDNSDITVKPSHNLNTKDLFLRMVSMVLIVALLGVAIIYIQKKLQPKFAKLQNRKIAIAETIHLGRNKSLHIVRVGSKQFLIGNTNENITTLADVTEALNGMEVSAKKTDDSRGL